MAGLRGFKLIEFYVATAVFQVANMYRPKNHRLDTLPILAHLSLAGHSLSPLEFSSAILPVGPTKSLTFSPGDQRVAKL